MNRLYRDLAPITDRAWAEIDDEAGRTLRHHLAARQFVEYVGPRGWDLAAVPTGRVGPADGLDAPDGVDVAVRETQPVVELRTTFRLAREELEVLERGGEPDLDPAVDAARRAAFAEDRAVFHGLGAAVPGMAGTSPHDAIAIGDDYATFPATVARAVEVLRDAGVGGPFGVALGPHCYTAVQEATERGYPVMKHLRLVADGPIVWAPGVHGSVVLSTRGGDFELVGAADFEVGYLGHDAGAVELFLREAFAFRVLEPAAAVHLVHG